MNILFRVDAATHIGSGHVMRCLTLAHKLSKIGANCIFVCRLFDGNLCDLITENGFQVLTLPAEFVNINPNQLVPHEHWLGVSYKDDAMEVIELLAELNIEIDWLIIDHYAIDKRWELLLKPYVKKIMVIDDLADRRHVCDVLLDQNYFISKSNRYEQLVSKNTILLLGPSYALLKEQFYFIREHLIDYAMRFKNGKIVVFFGGMDSTNETLKALNGISENLKTGDSIQVILGVRNANIESLKSKFHYNSKISFHIQVSNIYDYLAAGYLFIGATGATIWECCALSIPSIITSIASNQIQVAKNLSLYKSHFYLGESNCLSEVDYKNAYLDICNNYLELLKMSNLCAELISENKLDNSLGILNA